MILLGKPVNHKVRVTIYIRFMIKIKKLWELPLLPRGKRDLNL